MMHKLCDGKGLVVPYPYLLATWIFWKRLQKCTTQLSTELKIINIWVHNFALGRTGQDQGHKRCVIMIF